MPKIKLDDIEYHTEDLSAHGQAILTSLQFVEAQLQKIKNEIEVYHTAQRTYVAALKVEINNLGIQPVPAKGLIKE